MQYDNLKALLYNSSSSRKFFFSLNVESQMALHKYSDYIHTLYDLLSINDALNKYNKQVLISNFLFANYNSWL